MNVEDIKEITIKKLLSNEETYNLYNQIMTVIIDLANKGITSTDVGIWEMLGSYEAKQDIRTIFELKGFKVSPIDSIISWSSRNPLDSEY